MNTFGQIMALIAAGIAVFFLYRIIKNQPHLFTKEKFSQTLGTMGVLALALIVFVAFLVMMLRH
jgi:hypothetical protein